MIILMLCIKIFFVRILDVSLGTFRSVLTIKGDKFFAVLIGFIEILIWFLIVRDALTSDVDSIWIAISYSSGFATGTLVGMIVADKLTKGNFEIQIITFHKELIELLKDKGFGLTPIETIDNKFMILVSIDKKRYKEIKKFIKSVDKDAFIMVDESKAVYNGYYSK